MRFKLPDFFCFDRFINLQQTNQGSLFKSSSIVPPAIVWYLFFWVKKRYHSLVSSVAAFSYLVITGTIRRMRVHCVHLVTQVAVFHLEIDAIVFYHGVLILSLYGWILFCYRGQPHSPIIFQNEEAFEELLFL